MPARRKQIINWYPTRRCWRKKYKGKIYYLATRGECKGEDDQEGYQMALMEFFDIKKRVDAGQPARPEDEPPAETSRPVAKLDIRLPKREMMQVATVAPVESERVAAVSFHDYSNDPEELPQATLIQPETATVDELIQAFVDDFKHRAEIGDCSIQTYRESRDSLEDFQGYARKYKRSRMAQVDEHLLKCYRDRQRELVQQGENGPHTAKKRLYYLKRFLEWAYKHRYLGSEFFKAGNIGYGCHTHIGFHECSRKGVQNSRSPSDWSG